MNAILLFGIWYVDNTKIKVLSSFHFATRLNSRRDMKLILLMNSETLIDIWILVIPNGIIEVSIIWNCLFFTLFQFLSWLLTSYHLQLFCIYFVVRKGAMWKTCFSAPRNAKKENQLKHKNQARNRLFIDSLRV